MPGAESFDVVVVGAGAAGCLAASRLAAGRRVLLLEAGPDLRENTPRALHDGWGLNRDYYWGTKSEPDETGAVRGIPRCRLVGGTSWMTRFAVRGSPADFEEWSSMGCPGWRFEDVLPYLISLESDIDYPDRDFHGASGPIPVDRYLDIERSEIHELAAQACESLGIPAVDDHNRPGAVGVGRMPMSSKGGIRVSAADAFLPLGQTPEQLVVRANTVVEKVVVDGTRARGVMLADGTVIEAGWVVLSAGVFASPAILMRSGIGPADELQALGIRVVADLPGVGQGLGDHPATDLDCGYEGSFRPTPLLHSIATFHSRLTSSNAAPDLMLWLADPDEDGFFITIVLLKPETRGSVHLRSTEVEAAPAVRLPPLHAGRDLERLVEGYRMALEVAHEPSLRPLLRPRHDSRLTDDEIQDLVRADYASIPHFVGTCAMGPADDGNAVVDTLGRAHGIDGLSVIDASIIPVVPSGFTHLPTLAVAERISSGLAESL